MPRDPARLSEHVSPPFRDRTAAPIASVSTLRSGTGTGSGWPSKTATASILVVLEGHPTTSESPNDAWEVNTLNTLNDSNGHLQDLATAGSAPLAGRPGDARPDNPPDRRHPAVTACRTASRRTRPPWNHGGADHALLLRYRSRSRSTATCLSRSTSAAGPRSSHAGQTPLLLAWATRPAACSRSRPQTTHFLNQ